MKRKCFLVTATMLISVSAALMPSIAKADVHVYDKNNQYLGILLELGDKEIIVFIPSLAARFSIEAPDDCDLPGRVVFESDNCTGTPYVETYSSPSIYDIVHLIGGFYKPDYSSKKTFTPLSNTWDGCACESNGGENTEYIPLTYVQMPFTTPIAYPVSFKVETKSEVMPFPIVVAPKNQ